MASIRDVVKVLRNREGVDAVIVLGRDGLPIDSRTSDALDSENVAALVTPIVESCTRLGEASGRGDFGFGVVEFDHGLAVIGELTSDTLLAILVQPEVNIGQLLFELRRHRAAIAQLL
jgi:predicted regulator of Ras-like GTPase activity (Roadblock/LC7/MglB family)